MIRPATFVPAIYVSAASKTLTTRASLSSTMIIQWSARMSIGITGNPVFRRSEAKGLARVVCFSPTHDGHFRNFSSAHASDILLALREQVRDLSEKPGVASVLYFENRGEITGTSNPHPHGQLYATNFVFRNVADELDAVVEHHRSFGKGLFQDWMERERSDGQRVVVENEQAIGILPYFARYPYEVWLLPKSNRSRLADCTEEETAALGGLYRDLCVKYDLLHGQDFPYVCSLYEAPRSVEVADYRMHFTFLPPMRRPGLQKFPAGPEIGGGNFMNDTLPENCAAQLRGMTT
jgi:UDPglucose--hexose-1-phosphate uridylyltransferase